MPDPEHELWRFAAANRADIDTLIRETERLRSRQHELANEVAALRNIGKAVEQLARDVRHMSEQIEPVVRRAVRRPTVPVAQTIAAYLAVLIALGALLFTALHG